MVAAWLAHYAISSMVSEEGWRGSAADWAEGACMEAKEGSART